jgi:hypothetical protein
VSSPISSFSQISKILANEIALRKTYCRNNIFLYQRQGDLYKYCIILIFFQYKHNFSWLHKMLFKSLKYIYIAVRVIPRLIFSYRSVSTQIKNL